MPGWTKDEAQEYLRMWLDAEKAVSSGLSYKIGSRQLTRVDLSEIAERIKYWLNEVERLEAGRPRGCRVLRAVPRDL